MIYIFAALYCEVQPIIEHYDLVKDTDITKFQVFSGSKDNKDVMAVVTGTGAVQAAIAVSFICAEFKPEDTDFMVNIGTCATYNQDVDLGSVFYCNKITESWTKRTFYPDVLIAHAFDEKPLVTCAQVTGKIKSRTYCQESNPECNPDSGIGCDLEGRSGCEDFYSDSLYDMEAAGIYQAAKIFFKQHCMSFIKIVSDYGVDRNSDGQKDDDFISNHNDLKYRITGYVTDNLNKITDYLDNLLSISYIDITITDNDEYLDKLARDMHCSVVMKAELGQYLRYLKLAGVDYQPEIQKLYDDGCLPCKAKKEGKIYLEQLKQQFL